MEIGNASEAVTWRLDASQQQHSFPCPFTGPMLPCTYAAQPTSTDVQRYREMAENPHIRWRSFY